MVRGAAKPRVSNDEATGWPHQPSLLATTSSISSSKFRHAASISADQSAPKTSRKVAAITPKKRDEQLARGAVGVMRGYFAFDDAEVPGAGTGEIQHRFDRQRQHRALDQFAALGPEHRYRFGVFGMQTAIDQRRQIVAAQGGDFKAPLDRIG